MNRLSRLGSLVLVLVASCSSPAPQKLSLLPSKADQRTFEDERLRKMQMVRVIDEKGDTHELDAFPALEHFAAGSCPLDPDLGSADCNSRVLNLRIGYCWAEVELAMAGLTPSALTYSDAVHTYKLVPQTAATNASLANGAGMQFEQVMSDAVSIMRHNDPYTNCTLSELVDTYVPTGVTFDGSPAEHDDGSRRSEIVGSIFRDSYRAALEAQTGAITNTLAESDAQMAGAPTLQIGLARSYAGNFLSRAAAAHLWLGGMPGLQGDTTFTQCSSPRLSGPARRALGIFRSAGVSPVDVLNEPGSPNAGGNPISTEDLVDGTGLGSGTVRDRIDYFQNITIPTSPTKVWDYYGLTAADFGEARQALKDEITIFSRSLTAQLTDTTLSGGAAHTYARYAATASPPAERDPAYWMAITLAGQAYWRNSQAGTASPDFLVNGLSCGTNLATDETDCLLPFSTVVDYGHAWANYLLSAPELVPSDPTNADAINGTLKSDIFAPLATLATSGDRAGRLTQCSDSATGYASLTVYGYAATAGLILVPGDDNLECATHGSIEGAPCSITGSVPLSISDVQAQFSQGAYGALPNTTLLATPRWYVLQPKQPGSTPAPGGWKSVAGFTSAEVPFYPTQVQCRDIPIVPVAIAGAAKALSPSSEWCGQPTYECDDVRFDERLPLEDELTQDNDGVESSWKHYLTLAHTAASQADELGQAYLTAASAVDNNIQQVSLRQQSQQEKAAAELDTLQSVCGTAIDASQLVAAFGATATGAPNLSNVIGTTCNDGDPPTDDGFPCINEKRVMDWRKKLSTPVLQSLADCLATFDNTEEVGLGNTALCKQSGKVTLGDPSKDCNTGACSSGTCVPKADSLGFFDSPTVYPSTSADLCDDIRTARKQGQLSGPLRTLIANMAIGRIVKSQAFTTGSVRAAAQSADVHLDYGGVVAVHIGGASYATAAANGNWPCGAQRITGCASGENTLFCQQWDCTTPQGLAQANDRLYQAVLAAKLLTWTQSAPLPVIETPSVLYWPIVPLNGQQGSIRSGNYFIDVNSNDRWRMFVPDISDIPPGSTARWALTVPAAPWVIDAYQPNLADGSRTLTSNSYAAVERQTIEHLAKHSDLLLPFWGGLASNQVDAGYIKKALLGQKWEDIVPADVIDMLDSHDSTFGLSFDYTPYNCDFTHKSCPPSSEMNDNLKVYELAPAVGSSSPNLPFFKSNPDDPKVHVLAGQNLVTEFSIKDRGQAALDSLEMMCDGMANSTDGVIPGGNCNGGHAPPINSVADLENLGAYMECLGDDITRRMVTTLFVGVPAAVVTDLVHSGKVNTAGGGELDTALSTIREALDTVASAGPSIGGTVHRFGQDLRGLRAVLQSLDIDQHIDDVKVQSETANQITSCVDAYADAISGLSLGAPGSGVGGAIKQMATCANSAAQIGFAIQTNQLVKDKNTAEREKAIADFGGRFTDYVTQLQTQGGQLSTAIEHVFGTLTTIEGLKAKADRSVDNALWLLSEQAAKQGEISSALSNVSEGTRIRYERALSNARKTASLAKRAVEQRLGVSLDDMVDDLPLVAAPASWASKVCTTSGIDYQALAKSTSTDQAENFADAFIGDYVNKLDNVVESYRLKNNFHEGTDTAVVSLRDDVDATRATCSVPSRNLLLNASRLDHIADPSVSHADWAIAGCTTETLSASANNVAGTRNLPNCVGVTRGTEAPFLDTRLLDTPPVLGYELRFNNGTDTCTGCGWTSAAALQQSVSVSGGRYRLSWYTKDAATITGFPSTAGVSYYTSSPETAAVAVVKTSDGTVLHAVDTLSGFVPPANTGDWNRAYFVFDVPNADSITVAFKYPGGSNYTVHAAAPMLEKLDDPTGATSSFSPQAFWDTGDTRMSQAQVCEDTDGAVFRAKKWQRGCAMLCPDGYASDCRNRALQECYWETSFNINQNGIDTGTLFGESGFARGNFNYRIDTIGLNFVGTGLRNCQDSAQPTTCNAAGFVPYSIYHEGPYFVRNHKGQDFESHLFTAAIEHARGLGTERYLTNPMSQTDKDLITPYFRQEFQGRPLDGDFVVRVWDSDGLSFDAIQDVQIVLNYRYWTRFN